VLYVSVIYFRGEGVMSVIHVTLLGEEGVEKLAHVWTAPNIAIWSILLSFVNVFIVFKYLLLSIGIVLCHFCTFTALV